MSETEIDKLIYDNFNRFGDIQVITNDNDKEKEKRYRLESTGIIFSTGTRRILTH